MEQRDEQCEHPRHAQGASIGGRADSVQVDLRNRCAVRVSGVVMFEQKADDPIRQKIVLGSW